jgi:hypothetical protein
MDHFPAAGFPSRLVAAQGTFIVAAVVAAVCTWTPDAIVFLAIFLPGWALLYVAFEVLRFLKALVDMQSRHPGWMPSSYGGPSLPGRSIEGAYCYTTRTASVS